MKAATRRAGLADKWRQAQRMGYDVPEPRLPKALNEERMAAKRARRNRLRNRKARKSRRYKR